MRTNVMERAAFQAADSVLMQGLRFMMFPGERHGWVVMLDGEPFERHEFVDRRLALDYAKGWAAGNRPSALVILDEMGAPSQSWTFS